MISLNWTSFFKVIFSYYSSICDSDCADGATSFCAHIGGISNGTQDVDEISFRAVSFATLDMASQEKTLACCGELFCWGLMLNPPAERTAPKNNSK